MEEDCGKGTKVPDESITPVTSAQQGSLGEEESPTDVLGELGYKQSYRRAFKWLANTCMAIAIATRMGAILVVGEYQIYYGGYFGMIWGWLIPGVILFPQVLAVAELCSAIPVNWSFYWWSAAPVPPGWSKFAAFISGWTLILSMATSVSSFAYACAAPLTLVISLLHLNWTRTNSEIFAISLAICVAWIRLACWRLENISILVIVNASVILICTVVFLVGIPAARSAQGLAFANAKEVFTSFTNSSSWTAGMAGCLTFLSSAWVVTGWVTPAYMVEGTQNPQISAPKANINAYVLMAGIGLPVCIVCAFCVSDMAAAAADETGYPLFTMLFETWGVKGGAAFFLISSVNAILGGPSNLFSGACNTAAFARDGGLPFADFFAKIDEKRSVPLNSILLLAGTGSNFLLFGLSNAASSIIYSLAVIAAIVNYALSMFFALAFPHLYVKGPFNYGRWSRPIMAWACCTQIFLLILESLPSENSAALATYNFGWAVTLLVIACAIVAWPFFKDRFRGVDVEKIERWRNAPSHKGRVLAHPSTIS